MRKFLIVLAVFVVIFIAPMYFYVNRGPWYLGCSDGKGVEYLVEVDDKPRIDGNFIKIGRDTFITPIPGMTCRIVTVREIELQKAEQVIDN